MIMNMSETSPILMLGSLNFLRRHLWTCTGIWHPGTPAQGPGNGWAKCCNLSIPRFSPSSCLPPVWLVCLYPFRRERERRTQGWTRLPRKHWGEWTQRQPRRSWPRRTSRYWIEHLNSAAHVVTVTAAPWCFLSPVCLPQLRLKQEVWQENDNFLWQ